MSTSERNNSDTAADHALQALRATFYAPQGAASVWVGRLLTEWLATRQRFEIEVSHPGGYLLFKLRPTYQPFRSVDYATVNDLLAQPNGQKVIGEKRDGTRGFVPAHLNRDFEAALWAAQKTFIVRCGVPTGEVDGLIEDNEVVLEWQATWLVDFVGRPLVEVLDEAYGL